MAEMEPLDKLYSVKPGDILHIVDMNTRRNVRFIVHRVADTYNKTPSTAHDTGEKYIRLKLSVVLMTPMDLYEGGVRGVVETFELYKFTRQRFAYFNFDTKARSDAIAYVRRGNSPEKRGEEEVLS
jgi:hypothetical protein